MICCIMEQVQTFPIISRKDYYLLFKWSVPPKSSSLYSYLHMPFIVIINFCWLYLYLKAIRMLIQQFYLLENEGLNLTQ